jgi:hypothetical protein
MRGLENDVYFQVGLLTVIGLSAKNAILIVEFANELNERGRFTRRHAVGLSPASAADPDDLAGLYFWGPADGDQHRRRFR